MFENRQTLLLLLHLACVSSWTPTKLGRSLSSSRPKVPCSIIATKAEKDSDSSGGWSVSDDWSSLSSQNPLRSDFDTSKLFNQDLARNAARDLEAAAGTEDAPSEEDQWISGIVEEIHNSFTTLDDTPIYDTAFDEEDFMKTNTDHTMDNMGEEIAMLVRCNESPEDLLISQGRALPPLTETEKSNPSQLVTWKKDEFQATTFLKEAVSKMFHKHAVKGNKDDQLGLDRAGIAKWMTQALRSEKKEGFVSAHDKRVLTTMSDFSSYGSGRLLEDDFQRLYMAAIVGDPKKVCSGQVAPNRHLQLRQPYIEQVWRDIRNHFILSPVEQERRKLEEEVRAKNEAAGRNHAGRIDLSATVMDECEILDWDYRPGMMDKAEEEHSNSKRRATGNKSSHKNLEVAKDGKTPLWVRDGDFVFIDEDSCIGCMQCVNVAPNSFLMLDSGRARTFAQKSSPDVKQAVASCPVDCMHPVSYRELKEFETARDNGDGRTDHRHLGNPRGEIPLHVSRRESDCNRRSSWYHTLKHKCYVSSDCPKKGCYDCPLFNEPGGNPNFQKQYKEAEHIRAQYFIDNGDVDIFRKTADL